MKSDKKQDIAERLCTLFREELGSVGLVHYSQLRILVEKLVKQVVIEATMVDKFHTNWMNVAEHKVSSLVLFPNPETARMEGWDLSEVKPAPKRVYCRWHDEKRNSVLLFWKSTVDGVEQYYATRTSSSFEDKVFKQIPFESVWSYAITDDSYQVIHATEDKTVAAPNVRSLSTMLAALRTEGWQILTVQENRFPNNVPCVRWYFRKHDAVISGAGNGNDADWHALNEALRQASGLGLPG